MLLARINKHVPYYATRQDHVIVFGEASGLSVIAQPESDFSINISCKL